MNLANNFSNIIDSMADSYDNKVTVSLLELLWKKPPLLISAMLSAAAHSWDVESGDPLRAYFVQFGPKWLELKEIINDWDQLLGEDMAPATQDQVFLQVATDAILQGTSLMLPTPTNSSLDSLTTWAGNVGQFLSNEVGVITGSTPFPTVAPTVGPLTGVPSDVAPLVPSEVSSGVPGGVLPSVPLTAPTTGQDPLVIRLFRKLVAIPAISGAIPGVTSGAPVQSLLIPPQIAQALLLLNRTNLWMTEYFYPVSDWAQVQ
jgi:hypothetical protein